MKVTAKATPIITTVSFDVGYVNRSYSFRPNASGSGTLSWSIDNSNALAEAGLSFNASTGRIYGTPNRAVQLTFNLTVTSTYGTDTREFTITILDSSASPTSPKITTSQDVLPTAYVGASYKFTFSSSLSSGVTWYIEEDETDTDDFTISTRGVLSGKPTEDGTFSITVSVQDNKGGIDTKTFELNVEDASENPNRPVISTEQENIPEGFVNASYKFEFSASSSLRLTWSMDEDIPGLTLSSRGILSGKPVSKGSFDVNITVEDSSGGRDTKSFVISIRGQDEIEGRPVILTSQSDIPAGYVKTKYSHKFAINLSPQVFFQQHGK